MSRPGDGLRPSSRSAEHGFTLPWRSAEHGFTLVELLVALTIFGMLSAAGVALLSFSVRSQQVSDEALADLSALRRADALLAGDLGQAISRITRNAAGAREPAFRGGNGQNGLALAFTRRGWENVRGTQRPSIQKVEYVLNGTRLERRFYPFADGSPNATAIGLLEGVRGLRLRYRDAEGEWRDRWDPQRPDALPRAVELVLSLDRGDVRQVYLAGTTS